MRTNLLFVGDDVRSLILEQESLSLLTSAPTEIKA
jgi:hypothetical protein